MRKKRGDGFYQAVMEDVERRLLRRARDVEGLDEEIALLRVNLALELSQHPKNREFLLKALPVLTKAMATRARYSPGNEKGLSDKVMEGMEKMRKAFLGEGEKDQK